MKYPDWLYGYDSFMDMPKNYQEYFVRLYYFNTSEKLKIPKTIPVEHVEEYIAEHVNGIHMWCAKGFAAARNVDDGDNLDFKNDAEFHMVCHFCAKMYYKMGVDNGWFDANISKEDFEQACNTISFNGFTKIHL